MNLDSTYTIQKYLPASGWWRIAPQFKIAHNGPRPSAWHRWWAKFLLGWTWENP